MSVTFVIVALLGLLALGVVAVATAVEARPAIRHWRERREQHPWAYQETVQVLPVALARRRRPPRHDASGHVVTFAVGLLLVAAAVWEWSHFGFRGEWRAVEGQVVDARLESGGGSPATIGAPRAVLQFRYAVGERDFRSLWIEEAGGSLFEGLRAPDDFLARFRPGQPLLVWYHPLLPMYPSLARVSLWYVLAGLVAGALLLAAGAVALLAARRRHGVERPRTGG